MIIENATSLNSYLKTLQKNLLDADMEIDMLKIAQCFAGSQGFESEAEFVGKLPIMLDSAADSSQRFIDLLTKSGAKGSAPYFSSGILKATARDYQYFPIPELALYGENYISVADISREDLTKIYFDNRFLIDHSFSDIELRQVVAQEILNSGLAVNAESLFDILQQLRDAAVDEYDYAQLSVTTEDYKTAVEYLVKVAKSDTGTSVAAAQLLLSVHNGHCWHMSLTDLGRFDYRGSHAALIVIRGWISIREYPSSMIDDGEEVFAELVEKWHHLHVSKRYGHLYSNKV